MYRKSSMTSVFVVLLIAAVVCFCGLGSAVDGKWFQNGDLATWFNSWGKGQVQEQPADNNGENTQNGQQNLSTEIVSNSGEFAVTDSSDEGLTLLCAPISDLTVVSLSANAPANYVAAYSLTVTASPVAAAVPAIDWSVAFQNASSTWATGKTVSDYVVIFPDSDGAATATAYCLAAFGEPIVLTVTGRVNNQLTSSVVCHWLRSVDSLYYNFVGSNAIGHFSIKSTEDFEIKDLSNQNPQTVINGLDAGNGYVAINRTEEAYTRQPTVVSGTESVTIQITRQFATSLTNAGLTPASVDTNITVPVGSSYIDLVCLLTSSAQMSNGGYLNDTNYNKFITACQAMGSTAALRVTVSADLTTIGTKTTSFDLAIDSSSAAFMATSLSFSDSEVVFYATPVAAQSGSSGFNPDPDPNGPVPPDDPE